MKATSGFGSSPDSLALVWNMPNWTPISLSAAILSCSLILMPSLVSATAAMLAALRSSISSHGSTVAPSP